MSEWCWQSRILFTGDGIAHCTLDWFGAEIPRRNLRAGTERAPIASGAYVDEGIVDDEQSTWDHVVDIGDLANALPENSVTGSPFRIRTGILDAEAWGLESAI